MRSVVLASYQGERFIGEQLDSILAQLAPEDEVVVSDDASTDHTLEVVAARRDPRVRVLANTIRLGYVKNFARAIEQSRGHHIYFSDQDDVWLPNKVGMLETALLASACVASDAIVVNERLEKLHDSYFESRRARSFSAAALLLRPKIIGATIACRRSYLEELLPVPEGVPHDFWLSVNAAFDSKLAVLESPLILYRRHSSVASPTATSRKRSPWIMFTERFRLLASLLGRRLKSARSAQSSSRV